MSDQKQSEKEESNGIEIPALTSKPKKILMSLGFGVFILLLLISIFWDKPKKETAKIQEQDIDLNLNYSAPKIQASQDETLKNSPTTSAQINHGKEESPDDKVTQLRQNAPIQLYQAPDDKIQAPVDSNVQDKVPLNSVQNDSSQNSAVLQNTDNNISQSSTIGNASQVVQLKHRDYLLLEGTIIPGILQTAIHSDLSGNLKAQVAEDVYASKGYRILIPKGSMLLGRYAGNSTAQQSRIYVVWTRIIRPDGISITLQAQGTDEVGQAGLTGNINHHFFARFGQASLLSLLGVGAASSSLYTASDYSLALAGGFANTGKESLQESNHIKPTITIKAGSDVAVYVNQDISFYELLH